MVILFMKAIPLSNKQRAIVDDADHDWLNEFTWCYTGQYAQTQVDKKRIKMHRMILNPAINVAVDHINGDGLDNRRSNLRICTNSENQYNRKRGKNNTTGYKGIKRQGNKWQAKIGYQGKQRYLGTFETPEEAAQAYDKAAIELYGDFARGNLTESPETVGKYKLPAPRGKRLRRVNTSGFCGVCWNKRERKWVAHIRVNYKKNHLGYFDDPVQAAHAYDRAAVKARGESAQLNFP